MLIVGTYGKLAWEDMNASARPSPWRPAALLERWPQVFGINITFNILHNNWFNFTKNDFDELPKPEILCEVDSTEYAREFKPNLSLQ